MIEVRKRQDTCIASKENKRQGKIFLPDKNILPKLRENKQLWTVKEKHRDNFSWQPTVILQGGELDIDGNRER